MKTIATINFRPGVGKTTITWCLGDILSTFSDSKVLIFDLGTQMCLTHAIALDADGSSSEKFNKWHRKSIDHQRDLYSVLNLHLKSDLTNFNPDSEFVYRLKKTHHFVPSTEKLHWLDLENLIPAKGKFFIKNLLGRIQNSGSLPSYDCVLIDCPPSFTTLSYSVLICCDLILIPFSPDFFAAREIGLLIAELNHQIQPHPLPRLGVFANRAETWGSRPTRLAQSWINDVRDACVQAQISNNLDVRYMDAWIPDRNSLRDAIIDHKTPDELEGDFRLLWEEANSFL